VPVCKRGKKNNIYIERERESEREREREREGEREERHNTSCNHPNLATHTTHLQNKPKSTHRLVHDASKHRHANNDIKEIDHSH